jgi:hypothetical protein
VYPVGVYLSCKFTHLPFIFSWGSTNHIQPLLHYRAVARTTRARVLDVFMCILGAVGMVYTTALTVQSWIDGGAPKMPGYCDSK